MKRILPLFLVGWTFACINVPDIEPEPEPEIPEENSPPDAGTPLADLRVTITEPVDKAYTSTSITLTVEVRGGVADTVQLLKDGERLTTLTPPWKYTWDTTREAEGGYSLTARALRGTQAFTSPPVVVVVDRTHLQVATRTPAHNATNVDSSQPIRVTFTKPVRAETLGDTTVSLAVAGVLADKTLTLSADGKELTITPKETPDLPARFSIGLSRGITDLAGNALVLPGTPWSFEVPEWYVLSDALQAVPTEGTGLKDPAMVLDLNDNPIVAWSEELTPGGRTAIFASRWNGQGFEPLGGALNGTFTGSAYYPALTLMGDGHPVVAWHESDGFNENIYVKRWTGTTWQTVGNGALSAETDTRSKPVPTPALKPTIAARQEELYVAWEEKTVEGYSTIHVWKSSQDGPFTGVGNATGTVKAYPGATNGVSPALTLTSAGQPIICFQEQTVPQGAESRIHVMSLVSGSWAFATPPPRLDSTPPNPGGLSANPAYAEATDCSLSTNALNTTTYLSWTEPSQKDGPTDIHVFQMAGAQTWSRVGTPLSQYPGRTFASHSKIRSSPHTLPVLTWQEQAWQENGELKQKLATSVWSEKWLAISSPQKPITLKHSNRSDLLVDSHNRPMILWFESTYNGSTFTGSELQLSRQNKIAM